MNLDEQLDELLDKYYAPIKLPDNNRNGLKQAIKQLMLEARIDELETVKLDYGNWVATTYREGEWVKIIDRVEQLSNQIKGDK